MPRKLLLVDYENKHHLDLSALDASYSAVVFVGHHQPEPKIKKKIDSKNKYVRIDYQKIEGYGKNSLDFHIAFTLGRIFETYVDTQCYILSSDKGFDPLIKHLEANNFSCKRIESIAELPLESTEEAPTKKPNIKYGLNVENPELSICPSCKKTSTIEHNGGRWCTNCGKFASPPDPKITSKLIENPRVNSKSIHKSSLFCSSCKQAISTGDGVYDDGEWTCWGCLKPTVS